MKRQIVRTVLMTGAVLGLVANLSLAADAPSPAPADDQGGCCACPPDPKVTGDVYLGPATRYLFRGNRLSPSGTFVVQGGIDLYYKDVTFSYWANYQNRDPYAVDESGESTNYSRGKITETDLIVDWAVPYKLPGLQDLKFNLGSQYFSVDATNDTNEFYLKAAYETLLNPTFTVYWDVMAAREDGLFYTAAVSHSFEIERNLLALNVGALASYNQHNPSAAYTDADATSGLYSGWHNYELSVALDYKPTAALTITPSYLYSNALSGAARDLAGLEAQHAVALKATFAF